MTQINSDKYLNNAACLLLFILTAILISSSCSNSKLHAKKKQFGNMSDKELLSYYHQLDKRLDDIDKNTEHNKVTDNTHYDPDRDRITHLHIDDKWGQLREEKKLVLRELNK